MPPRAMSKQRSFPFGNRFFCNRAMGKRIIHAIKNRKKSREWVWMPDRYANFAKIGMAP
jgi:hypothetical protein